jgi:phosphotriesterase-related protein
MGCSYYVGATHPPAMDAKSEADITREIVAELRRGADGTGIRPGIIGEVGCSWPLLPTERKTLRASARAQRATGAPLMVHPGRHERAPQEIVAILEEAGADLGRTIMCHIDRTILRREPLRDLARTGCVIEYDLFGHEHALYPPNHAVDQPNDGMRLRFMRWLIDEGFGRQIVISHDIDNQIYLSRYGGPGYGHILENVVPLMRRRGFSREEIDAILIETPRRLLTFAPPEGG